MQSDQFWTSIDLLGLSTSRAARQVIGRDKIHSYILNLEQTSKKIPIGGSYIRKSQCSDSNMPPVKKPKIDE